MTATIINLSISLALQIGLPKETFPSITQGRRAFSAKLFVGLTLLNSSF